MVCGWLLWSRIPVSCCQLCIVELDQRQMLHTSWAPRKKNIVNVPARIYRPHPPFMIVCGEKNTIRRKFLQAFHLRCIFEELKKFSFLVSLHLPIFWWYKLKYSRGTAPPPPLPEYYIFYVFPYGSRKKSFFLNGSAIKTGWGRGVKGLSLRRKMNFFGTFI